MLNDHSNERNLNILVGNMQKKNYDSYKNCFRNHFRITYFKVFYDMIRSYDYSMMNFFFVQNNVTACSQISSKNSNDALNVI